jgi:tRNA/rRNA methyltransferase
VAICCYELAIWAEQQKSEISESQEVNPQRGQASWSQRTTDLAPLDALEGYYQQLETLLVKIGYLYPHTAASRMEKFRQLFGRAQLSQLEVAMLRGVLSQMDWALQKAASLFKLDSVDRQ